MSVVSINSQELSRAEMEPIKDQGFNIDWTNRLFPLMYYLDCVTHCVLELYRLIPEKLRDFANCQCLSPKDRTDVLWWAHRLHPQLLISWGIFLDDHTLVPDGLCELYLKEPLCVLDTVPLPRILAEKIGRSEFHVIGVLAVTHKWITLVYEEPMKDLE